MNNALSSIVPTGLAYATARTPSDESLGYSQSPRRGCICVAMPPLAGSVTHPEETKKKRGSLPRGDGTSDGLLSELADDDMVELVEMFVAGLPYRVVALEKAVSDEDIAVLAMLTHQLKGSAEGYGFPSITDAAKALEGNVKTSGITNYRLQDTTRLVRFRNL